MNLTTDDADGKIRLDQYLAAHLPELSRSRIQSLIKSGDVLVNGSPAKPKNPVSRGDSITVRIPEPEPAEAQPQDIPLDILYEDEDVVVINKESGMVVHPAAGNPDGTIVNALLHHCGDLSGIGGVERPGIVHRLDKDTSGCLVIAKNDGAHQSLTAQFAARSTEKRYLAVVQGIPSQSSGTVFTHIGRHPVNRLKMAVVNPGSGKAAITDYDLLCADPSTDSSLVLCTLHTGRTHQIRVHMLHLGHPLIGDPIYAKPARQKAKPGRLMLHACGWASTTRARESAWISKRPSRRNTRRGSSSSPTGFTGPSRSRARYRKTEDGTKPPRHFPAAEAASTDRIRESAIFKSQSRPGLRQQSAVIRRPHPCGQRCGNRPAVHLLTPPFRQERPRSQSAGNNILFINQGEMNLPGIFRACKKNPRRRPPL